MQNNLVYRSSNIELCRIISILLVIVLHSSFYSLGFPETKDSFTWFPAVLESFSIVGAPVFVLITGYFSTRPKIENFINIFFICLFPAAVIVIKKYFDSGGVNFQDMFVVSQSNWFVLAYLGLICFSPILNAFVDNVSKRQLLNCIIILLAFQTWFGFCPAYFFNHAVYKGYNNGYSIISFMNLYLIGRFVKLYGLPKIVKDCPLSFYSAFSLLTLFCFYWLNKHDMTASVAFSYANPLVIASSICFFVFFCNLEIKNSKIINHLAKSTLTVLILHLSKEAFSPLFKSQFVYLYSNTHGLIRIACWVLSILVVFLTFTLIDQMRLLLYKPVKNILSKYTKC